MITFHMLSVCNKHEPPNIRIQRTGICIMLLGIWNLSAADLGRSAGSVTFMGDQDGQVRDVETGKAEKGAGRSSWQKGEFAPAPDRAAQYTCFFARIL